MDNDEDNEIYKRPETIPIVIILPGITGKTSFVILDQVLFFVASTILKETVAQK